MTATNPDDSVLKVRRSIHVKASPQRVWGAFTTMERMDRWWGAKRGNPVAGQPTGQWLIAYEPKLAGRIEMAVDMDGSRAHFGGEIKVFETGRELTFENDWIPNRGWKAPTYMTVRLTPALEGTLVELFHHGFERTGGDVDAEHAGYEEGWGMLQLTSLKALVEGGRAKPH
jgi:uncharacterized protein YndB with AHSA1/START domain